MQKLSISSMSDLLFAGKKRVTLIGGGSYVKIDEGGIEYGTAHTYTRHVKRTQKLRPASMPVTMPYLPGDGKYDLALNFFDGSDAISGARYTIRFDGGIGLAGVLDEQGYALHKNVPPESATVTYQLPQPEPEKAWGPWDLLLEKTSVREE